jgi:two-component system sensor histidine kinase HydH
LPGARPKFQCPSHHAEPSGVSTWAWVHVLAAASGLALTALALSRRTASPLARPLAYLSISQFAWNAASVGRELAGSVGYQWLGAVAAPVFAPLALHFVLTFLGERRARLRLLRLTYAVFGLQSLGALGDALLPEPLLPGGVATWAALLLLTGVPLAAGGLWLLWRHLRRAVTNLERWRTRALVAALVVMTLFAFTDLLADLRLPVPRLASLGSFAFNVVLADLTLRLGLLERVPRRRMTLALVALVGLFGAATFLVLFVTLGEHVTLLLAAITCTSIALAVATSLLLSKSALEREGLERSATLGRFSSQMAHDLLNPLSAARGAAEFLGEALRRKSDDENVAFAGLIVDQLDRLRAILLRYQRLSRLEPAFEAVDLNVLVARVLSLQQFAAPSGTTLTRALAPSLPPVRADADLLASVLENLVKNSLEAMPRGGALTVSTRRREDDDGPRVCLAVRDTGGGIDARTRERLFEPFFTTKATGSGLGLAFVQQVVAAHEGRVSVESTEGVGTAVEVALPLFSC